MEPVSVAVSSTAVEASLRIVSVGATSLGAIETITASFDLQQFLKRLMFYDFKERKGVSERLEIDYEYKTKSFFSECETIPAMVLKSIPWLHIDIRQLSQYMNTD